MRLPVFEVMRWQIGKLYLPAIRSDKQEFRHDILRAAAQDAQGCKRRMPTHHCMCNRVIDVVLGTLRLAVTNQVRRGSISAERRPQSSCSVLQALSLPVLVRNALSAYEFPLTSYKRTRTEFIGS